MGKPLRNYFGLERHLFPDKFDTAIGQLFLMATPALKRLRDSSPKPEDAAILSQLVEQTRRDPLGTSHFVYLVLLDRDEIRKDPVRYMLTERAANRPTKEIAELLERECGLFRSDSESPKCRAIDRRRERLCDDEERLFRFAFGCLPRYFSDTDVKAWRLRMVEWVKSCAGTDDPRLSRAWNRHQRKSEEWAKKVRLLDDVQLITAVINRALAKAEKEGIDVSV